MKDYFLPNTKSEGLNEYCEKSETLWPNTFSIIATFHFW